jgi:predicted nucleic acid-binding protein
MTVVDTSVWIEYLRGNKKISDVLIPKLNSRKVIAISAVFGELLQGVRNTKERAVVTGFWENLPKETEDDIFIEAGQLSNEYKLFAQGVGLIDCYILAFSMHYDCALWTLDKKLLKAMDSIEEG